MQQNIRGSEEKQWRDPWEKLRYLKAVVLAGELGKKQMYLLGGDTHPEKD